MKHLTLMTLALELSALSVEKETPSHVLPAYLAACDSSGPSNKQRTPPPAGEETGAEEQMSSLH